MKNEFDEKASAWDANPMHLERSRAIAAGMRTMIPMQKSWEALEFGAGTGLLSLELKHELSSIQLLDSSLEMVRVMNGKLSEAGITSLKAHAVDLTTHPFPGQYDLVYTQMVMHHVADIDGMVAIFRSLLKPGGFLAIADLYPEDGSFHDGNFTGHCGFDVDRLADLLTRNHYTDITHKECFVIQRPSVNGEMRSYPVFLMVARNSIKQTE